MKPKNEQKTLEIFKVQLEEIINKEHPVVILTETIKWKALEEKLTAKYSEKMGGILPLKGYVLDLGSLPTHKGIIISLYEQGKSPADIV
jgi:hypothetical protein